MEIKPPLGLVLSIPWVVCKAPWLVFFTPIVCRITTIIVASHQFNGIEAVPMTAARIQRQVPRLASLPTNRDRDSTPVIRAVISVARMFWFDLLAHLDQAQPHAVVVIGRPRVCKRMSYEKSR